MPLDPTDLQYGVTPVYSPFQVRLATLLGGPIASFYTIYMNFRALGSRKGTLGTLAVGATYMFILALYISFVPPRSPNILIPILNVAIAGWVVRSKQFTPEQITESQHLEVVTKP